MNDIKYSIGEIGKLKNRLERILEITNGLSVQYYQEVSEWKYFKYFFSQEYNYKEALKSLTAHNHDIDSCNGNALYIIIRNDIS